MPFLIDGYNLIYAANILGRGIGPGGLERARQALLDFLHASLDERERRVTTVVFDAEHAPPGLPRSYEYQGIAVLFSAGYGDADELIEELIQKHSAPRKLTVVSSDHRLHRAARRRRARAVDSDIWYGEMVAKRLQQRRPTDTDETQQPSGPLVLPDEIERWSREIQSETQGDIFPPGYGDDVIDDES